MSNTLTLNPSSLIKYFDLSKILSVNIKVLRVLAVVALISLLAAYIFQINSETKDQAKVQELQTNLLKLSQENKNIELSFSNSESLAKTSEVLSQLNYEQINKIQYIKILGSSVVTK